VTTLLLVRHGETEWNRRQRWQGHADPPLNAAGRGQAAGLAAELKAEAIDAVYASDLRRAYETARILADGRGLPVNTVSALREVDVGEWSGLSMAEVEARHPAGVARWRSGAKGWERGESYSEMGVRVVEAITGILRAHTGETVLVVSHGGSIRAVVAQVRGMDYETQRRLDPLEVANCQVIRLAAEADGMRWID
jgi:broad specificity phosphatase PhoE